MKIFSKRETILQNMTTMAFFAAINIIICLVSSYVPFLSIVIIFVLPLVSALVEIYCKDRYYIIYAVASLLLSMLVTFDNFQTALFYLFPALVSGYCFGLCAKKIMLILPILLLSSCSIYQSSEQSFLSSQEVSINHEYEEIVNQKLLWNDIFSVAKTTYFVYFYSLVCQNCNSLKNEIIEYAIKNQNIFFVQDSKEFVFGNDILKTIGVSDISFFFISGFPTLIEIDNAILVNHVVGVNNIRKTLFL